MTYHNILYHTIPAPTIPYHTIPALAAALGVGGKNCQQMGISLRTNTNAAVPSNFHIMVEGCRGRATGLNLFWIGGRPGLPVNGLPFLPLP